MKVRKSVWILVIVTTIISVVAMNYVSKRDAPAYEARKVAERSNLTEKFPSVMEDVKTFTFDEAWKGLFNNVHLKGATDNRLELIMTVSDDWYTLPKYEQERALKLVFEAFNNIGAKYGLHANDKLAWEVTFVDSFDKQVAHQGFW